MTYNSISEIVSVDQFNTLIEGDQPVFIDFTAAWCGPCKKIYPSIVELAKVTPEVKFYKLDVDTDGFNDTLMKQGIRAMPTFKMYHKGKSLGNGVVGANLESIKLYVTNCLKHLSGTQDSSVDPSSTGEESD